MSVAAPPSPAGHGVRGLLSPRLAGVGVVGGLLSGLLGVGGGVGTALGSVLRRAGPEVLVVVVVAVTAVVSGWAALAYGLWPVLAAALAAGTAQALAKLCLDALVQREVPEAVRTSAFARSETVLQLAWVLGGFAGLALPLAASWGLGFAAIGAAAAAVAGVVGLVRLRAAAPAQTPGP